MSLPNRPDISPHLIHFTSGQDIHPFQRLRKIVYEQRLIAGSDKIKGAYPCVCFTEAPSHAVADGFVNAGGYSRYSQFGILFDKTWIYGQGGRPVIYQSDAEYSLLPENLRWRHVRYEPDAINFTWEREWRIRCAELAFDPRSAAIIVPSREWAEALFDEHQAEQDFQVLQYSQIMDEDIAEQYRYLYPWHFVILNV